MKRYPAPGMSRSNEPATAVPRRYQPTAAEVDDLIRRAAGHPLGTDFLINGALDAVAATFSVHAFAVEAARRHAAAGRSTHA